MKFLSRFLQRFQPTLEQQIVIGAEAKQLLENKRLQSAFDAVRDDLLMVALSTNPDDKEKCQRVIVSMQLNESIIRAIEREIETGELAKQHAQRIEQTRRQVEFRR